tara:strand:- start:4587 stop:5348 length:762 start_codon:yes stop_codon:yes gene_type:complete
MSHSCVNILLGGDHRSEAVTPTLINSINLNTNRDVHVVVLCRGWKRESFHSGKLRVDFVEYSGEINTPSSHQSSANDKLLYLEHLPEWDRCLILGWDQLVVGCLDDLYDLEFAEHQVITGVPYPSGKMRDLWTWKGKQGDLEAMFPDSILDSPGFDGGTHLVALDHYRQQGLASRLRHILEKLGGEDHLAMIGLFADKLLPIEAKWNVLCGKMHKISAKILHFNGGNKPWKPNNKKPVWEMFRCDWDFLQRSE